MKSKKQLQEEIAELKAELEAICQLAEEEDRDLDDKEQARFDAIAGVGKKGDDNHKAGEIAALEIELQRAERREELMAGRLQGRIDRGEVEVSGGEGPSGDPFGSITVPPSARRFPVNRLSGFEGADAVREAYASGMFVAAMIGNESARDWCDENGINYKAVMVEGTDGLGGVTIPEPLEAALIRLVEEFGIFRQYAGRKAMAALTDTVPRRIGGLKVFYPDEAAALTRSDLRLDKVTLTAKKYACLSELSTELNEDSVLEMISLLVREMAAAKAEAEDLNGFLGDGTATYASTTGLAAAIDAVSGDPSKLTASAIALGSLTMDDFEQCEAELPEFRGMSPAWYVNKSVWGKAMAPLMRAAGGNTVSDIANGVGKEFLGYPVRTTQVLPKTPAANDVIAFFGDLSMSSTLGTRRGMSFATSTEGDFFTNDTIGVKCTQRIAIENHDVGQEALAASGDQKAVTALAGPIVSLVAPAS